MSQWRKWFDLCRLPNAFTAVADPLAGALIAGATWRHAGSILAIMGCSACLYSAGVVLNDWHDYKTDMAERPERPLPAKRIMRIQALLLAIALFGAGGLLSSIPGSATTRVAMVLMATIVAYDILLKEIPIAPFFMGLCRSFNLMLGMVLVSSTQASSDWSLRVYAMSVMCVYIIGITVFARKEARETAVDYLLAGTIVTTIGILAAGLLRLVFPQEAPHTEGFIWTSLLMAVVIYRMSQAILTPKPPQIQRAVKTAVMGVILFDAALVAFTCGILASLPLVLLLIPACWLGTRFQST